LGGR
ncbi:hypothetical protein VCNEP21106_003474B, partial [Vibrio cholerae O1 str. Nep-21106]